MKHTKWNKLLSVVLALTMLAGLMVPGVSAAEPAAANLLGDAGFEAAPQNAPAAGVARTSNIWYGYNNGRTCTHTADEKREGSHSVKLSGSSDASVEQDVAGLETGKSYTFRVYAKGTAGNAVVGVKNHGSAEIKQAVQASADGWTANEITFTYTGSELPRVYVWGDRVGGPLYLDEASLTLAGEPQPEPQPDTDAEPVVEGNLLTDAGFENADPAGGPGTGHWSVWNHVTRDTAEKYKGTHALKVSAGARGGSSSEQDIAADKMTAGATYEFKIWAKLNKELAANAPAPEIGVKNYGGAQKIVNPRSTQWTQYTIEFVYESGIPRVFTWIGEEVDGSVVLYADTASLVKTKDAKPVEPQPEPEVPAPDHEARDFYVAASGSDTTGDGTLEKPFASIEKLNEIVFTAGDRILFKAGDTFTGTFKPQGSGTPDQPIVITRYGEGKKPVLQPGPTWRGKIQKANGNGTTLVQEVTYSGCIWLENVQGYEVRGLELSDPSYDPNNNRVNQFDVYAAGIRVVNQNKGDLRHFVFDDLSIHGFRGPGSNLGKSSGGIQFNVLVDERFPNDPAKNVKSAMHDITITNSEIYNCGRSGINFLNPWGRRPNSDPKWTRVVEGSLPWYPYTNFHMENNIIHHIDGDGLILDNVSNAVVEKNLCYETAIHLGEMHAAVGMFNWNSDDSYFQYNEVFNIGKNATNQGHGSGQPTLGVPGDAQGIEIDALNDRTWVQHNYLHDNRGGFMMWCNVNDKYPGYNGVIRYNISENDHIENHGAFHAFPYQYGSETYNNVFYLNPETAVNNGKVNLFFNGGSGDTHKMYNNIFYLAGDTAYPANKFEDGAYDWRSNIFYNFTNLPVIDSAQNPNIAISAAELAENPLFVNPGHTPDSQNPTAYRGLEQMRELLKGYQLVSGSPAVQAGVRLESMSTGIPVGMTGTFAPLTDFFGNVVAEDAKIDVGVHQSGMTAVRITSDAFAVNNMRKTITVTDTTISRAMLDSLRSDVALTAVAKRGGAPLADNVYLTAGDVVEITAGGEQLVYTVQVEKTAANMEEIPAAKHTAAAGNAQPGETADNVLNGSGKLWHTSWGGSPRDQHWLTLTIPAEEYKVTGLTYLPRSDNSSNGIITKYQVLGSNDGQEWTLLAEGDWELDHQRKYAAFDAPQSFTQYKLVSVESGSDQPDKNFTSAKEVRLLGFAQSADHKPAAPTGPQASVQGKDVVIQWAHPAESTAVRYEIRDGETVLAALPATETSVVLSGLPAGRDLHLTVVAVNLYGSASELAPVPVFQIPDDSKPFVWNGARLSIAGDIAVRFYGTFSEALTETGSVVITVQGQPDVKLPIAQAPVTEHGREFTAKLAVRQMTDDIAVKVMQGDVQVGETVHYTVQDNAKALIKLGTPAEAEFARAMLYHGAEMQKYKHYHDKDALATDGVDVTRQAEAAAAVTVESLAAYRPSVAGGPLNGLTPYGANLSLQDETALRFFFTMEEDHAADSYTFTANGKTYPAEKVDGMLCVELPTISASSLDAMIEMVVSDGENQMTVHYGPLSYARSAMQGHTAAEGVARSLVVYNTAAKALYK